MSHVTTAQKRISTKVDIALGFLIQLLYKKMLSVRLLKWSRMSYSNVFVSPASSTVAGTPGGGGGFKQCFLNVWMKELPGNLHLPWCSLTFAQASRLWKPHWPWGHPSCLWMLPACPRLSSRTAVIYAARGAGQGGGILHRWFVYRRALGNWIGRER